MTTMNNRMRAVKDVLWALALAGLVGAILRLWFGLGATTNLSDAVPWGLWKVFNMVAGVALSTSGFTVGFLVYVLRLKQFRPFMKPAILIAFLGYGCSCTALLLDIGLPLRFWHPIVMWNDNSFLFEVFWCVLLYFTVTAIELSPLIFERFRAEKVAHFLHHMAFGVVVVGISLSSLHHSSLGSLFLVTPQRLHPLWYTPLLPLLFIVSAMGSGMMVVVLAKIVWEHWYERSSAAEPSFGQQRPIPVPCARNLAPSPSEISEMPQIRSLATIAASILGVYLGLKVFDLFYHGAWRALLAGSWESWLYILELTLTAILPIVLMLLPWTRRSPAGITVSAASAALGLALNRLDVGIFGYFRSAGAVYFPSPVEWAVSLGVVAAAGLVFFFLAENLPIFSEEPLDLSSPADYFRSSYGIFRQLWNTALGDDLHRVTLIALIVIPCSFVLMYPRYYGKSISGDRVLPPIALDVQRKELQIGEQHGDVSAVLFHHADLQKQFGDAKSCSICHHVSLPRDKSTPCWRCHRDMNAPTDIFDHVYHMAAIAQRDHLKGLYSANYSCDRCHAANRPQTASDVKDCMECHKQDMFPAGPPLKKVDLRFAIPYREAMHRVCVDCHKTEAVKQNKPHLADCATCHASLRSRKAPAPTLVTLVTKGN